MKNVDNTKDFYWELLPNSPVASSRTDDIWFFDELTGWLVNSSGYVCKTEDGGANWTPKFFLPPNVPSKPYLRCMGWANRQYGWFGSVTGIGDAKLEYPSQYIKTLLHRTTDGGETWSAVRNLPENSPAGICGFYAVNEKVVYGSGTNDPGLPGPAIIKTTDAGENWELIDMQEHADNLIDIFFFDENNGFVVGGKITDQCDAQRDGYPAPRLIRYAQLKPVVLRTTDGGKSWTNTAADTADLACGEWGWKVQFLDEKRGFVCLENFVSAAILKTTDGGRSWTRHEVADASGKVINKDLEGIGFIDENRGWVGGWGNNFNGLMNSYTEDGGKTWVREDHSVTDPNSDPRVRINRYRLLGNPVNGGYCSGLQVYKFKFGKKQDKKTAFADAAPMSEPGERIAPARSGERLPEKGAIADKKNAFAEKSEAFAALPQDQALKFPENDFELTGKRLEDGSVEISYRLPEGVKNVFVGLWNQFAFYVRTLANGDIESSERQTIIWDGKDDQGNPVGEGVYICRMSADGEQGASTMVQLGTV